MHLVFFSTVLFFVTSSVEGHNEANEKTIQNLRRNLEHNKKCAKHDHKSQECGAASTKPETCCEGLECAPDDSFKCVHKLSCPEKNCADVIVTNLEPEGCSNELSLPEVVQLKQYQLGDDDLIEVLGPRNPDDAAAVVITVPHGGDMIFSDMADRSQNDKQYCPPTGCNTAEDSFTIELAIVLQRMFLVNFCKVPYIVLNHIHRSKMDANQELESATQDDPIAEEAWKTYHDFIQFAQTEVQNKFGTVNGSTGIEGVRGLLLDVHGYVGSDWHPNGSPFIHWGYRFASESLDPEEYCPLDERSNGSTGSLTHARWLPNQSLECLVRGPGSLGSRLKPLSNRCGASLPSTDFPSPRALEKDCSVCNAACGDNPTSCLYSNGGFTTMVHEYLDWETKTGPLFNTVQAEFPRCVRFNEEDRSQLAESLSVAICSFLGDLFGPEAGTC